MNVLVALVAINVEVIQSHEKASTVDEAFEGLSVAFNGSSSHWTARHCSSPLHRVLTPYNQSLKPPHGPSTPPHCYLMSQWHPPPPWHLLLPFNACGQSLYFFFVPLHLFGEIYPTSSPFSGFPLPVTTFTSPFTASPSPFNPLASPFNASAVTF